MMCDELFTIAQAAEYLKLSAKTVRKLITTRRLLAAKVGDRSWRIKKDDIETYFQANTNFSKIENGNGNYK
jgi:excisionase family DNA binding protein